MQGVGAIAHLLVGQAEGEPGVCVGRVNLCGALEGRDSLIVLAPVAKGDSPSSPRFGVVGAKGVLSRDACSTDRRR